VENLLQIIEDGALMRIFDRQLGTGGAREAYASDQFPDLVAKQMYWPLASTNAKEWLNWAKISAEAPDLVKWFAPCVAYDEKNDILVMKRTAPIPSRRWPLFIPDCFDTEKRENFGLYAGHFVCHDYATIRLHPCGSGFANPSMPPARGWRRAPWPGLLAGAKRGSQGLPECVRDEFFEQYFETYHAKVSEVQT
jgi:hypothetical protein